jgi:transcriptional regulator with GAF, ATPase, and Fis domain
LAEAQSTVARQVRALSLARWGAGRETILIGRDERFSDALDAVVRFAASDQPLLISGESGAGKELFARALFLSSPRIKGSFLTVNCAQYCSEHLIGSELFGHRRGAFTGAVGDRRGVFEEADGGVLLLDEISELPLQAQAMLLRVVAEGEIRPVGDSHARRVDVRVVAATNRHLPDMVEAGTFREDLYYRLRGHVVEVPPLRQRGDDWELIARHCLAGLAGRHGTAKSFSEEAEGSLRRHPWPGNVREVKHVVDAGYHLSDSALITSRDIGGMLEERTRKDQWSRMHHNDAERFCELMENGHGSFWEVIQGAYLDRELNRSQVREVISFALSHRAGGSYKRMLQRFGVADRDYLRAMDFLRHHRLKPTSPERNPRPGC